MTSLESAAFFENPLSKHQTTSQIFSNYCEKRGSGSRLWGSRSWKRRFVVVNVLHKTLSYYADAAAFAAHPQTPLKPALDLSAYETVTSNAQGKYETCLRLLPTLSKARGRPELALRHASAADQAGMLAAIAASRSKQTPATPEGTAAAAGIASLTATSLMSEEGIASTANPLKKVPFATPNQQLDIVDALSPCAAEAAFLAGLTALLGLNAPSMPSPQSAVTARPPLVDRESAMRHFIEAAKLGHAAAAYFLCPSLSGGDSVVSAASSEMIGTLFQVDALEWLAMGAGGCSEGRLAIVAAAAARASWQRAAARLQSIARVHERIAEFRKSLRVPSGVSFFTGDAMLPFLGLPMLVPEPARPLMLETLGRTHHESVVSGNLRFCELSWSHLIIAAKSVAGTLAASGGSTAMPRGPPVTRVIDVLCFPGGVLSGRVMSSRAQPPQSIDAGAFAARGARFVALLLRNGQDLGDAALSVESLAVDLHAAIAACDALAAKYVMSRHSVIAPRVSAGSFLSHRDTLNGWNAMHWLAWAGAQPSCSAHRLGLLAAALFESLDIDSVRLVLSMSDETDSIGTPLALATALGSTLSLETLLAPLVRAHVRSPGDSHLADARAFSFIWHHPRLVPSFIVALLTAGVVPLAAGPGIQAALSRMLRRTCALPHHVASSDVTALCIRSLVAAGASVAGIALEDPPLLVATRAHNTAAIKALTAAGADPLQCNANDWCAAVAETLADNSTFFSLVAIQPPATGRAPRGVLASNPKIKDLPLYYSLSYAEDAVARAQNRLHGRHPFYSPYSDQSHEDSSTKVLHVTRRRPVAVRGRLRVRAGNPFLVSTLRRAVPLYDPILSIEARAVLANLSPWMSAPHASSCWPVSGTYNSADSGIPTCTTSRAAYLSVLSRVVLSPSDSRPSNTQISKQPSVDKGENSCVHAAATALPVLPALSSYVMAAVQESLASHRRVREASGQRPTVPAPRKVGTSPPKLTALPPAQRWHGAGRSAGSAAARDAAAAACSLGALGPRHAALLKRPRFLQAFSALLLGRVVRRALRLPRLQRLCGYLKTLRWEGARLWREMELKSNDSTTSSATAARAAVTCGLAVEAAIGFTNARVLYADARRVSAELSAVLTVDFGLRAQLEVAAFLRRRINHRVFNTALPIDASPRAPCDPLTLSRGTLVYVAASNTTKSTMSRSRSSSSDSTSVESEAAGALLFSESTSRQVLIVDIVPDWTGTDCAVIVELPDATQGDDAPPALSSLIASFDSSFIHPGDYPQSESVEEQRFSCCGHRIRSSRHCLPGVTLAQARANAARVRDGISPSMTWSDAGVRLSELCKLPQRTVPLAALVRLFEDSYRLKRAAPSTLLTSPPATTGSTTVDSVPAAADGKSKLAGCRDRKLTSQELRAMLERFAKNEKHRRLVYMQAKHEQMLAEIEEHKPKMNPRSQMLVSKRTLAALEDTVRRRRLRESGIKNAGSTPQ